MNRKFTRPRNRQLQYSNREYYKLWDECLKGNHKTLSEKLEGWGEDNKMEMFYQSFVNRYAVIDKKKWDESNHKLKMFIYFDVFERVAKMNKFKRFLTTIFKLKSKYL